MRQPLAIHIKPERGAWLVSVAEAASTPALGAAPAPVLVRATLAFDALGRLERYAADGPYPFDLHNANLREAVRTHPLWAASDADVELMRLGGASTVGGAFTPNLGSAQEGIGRHLGTAVTATAGQFQWRGTPGASPGGAPPATLVKPAWVVEATGTDAAGLPVSYRLEYEPIGVTRTGGAVLSTPSSSPPRSPSRSPPQPPRRVSAASTRRRRTARWANPSRPAAGVWARAPSGTGIDAVVIWGCLVSSCAGTVAFWGAYSPTNGWFSQTSTAYVDLATVGLTIDRQGTGTGGVTASGLSCAGGASTQAVPCGATCVQHGGDAHGRA